MRTIWFYIYLITYMIGSIPLYLKASKLDKQGKIKEKDAIVEQAAYSWGQKMFNASGSTLEVIGVENVPRDKSVVFVANHQGNFDIPLVSGFVPVPKGFVSKEEIGNYLIFGKWMKLMNCVFIKRGNPREALKSINEAAKQIKAGYSQVIFPEGTRSRDGQIKKFKPGALKIAMKSKAPIVPITIIGTKDIMVKKSPVIKPASVKMIISEPVVVGEESTNELAEKLQGIIQGKMDQYS